MQVLLPLTNSKKSKHAFIRGLLHSVRLLCKSPFLSNRRHPLSPTLLVSAYMGTNRVISHTLRDHESHGNMQLLTYPPKVPPLSSLTIHIPAPNTILLEAFHPVSIWNHMSRKLEENYKKRDYNHSLMFWGKFAAA